VVYLLGLSQGDIGKGLCQEHACKCHLCVALAYCDSNLLVFPRVQKELLTLDLLTTAAVCRCFVLRPRATLELASVDAASFSGVWY
jgi:hypothetical protein